MGRERASNSYWFSGLLIIILAALIFFAPAYGWKIREFLSPPPAAPADAQDLAAENDSLKAQLATLQAIEAELPTSTPDEIRAMVYSRYPMDFKNELLVDAGMDEGVAPGAAVMFQGVLIGVVRTAFPKSAVVQTIFDSGLKMPVRIGSGGYDGLLQGGSAPEVGSIPENSSMSVGDVVYSVAPGIPYGLPVGEVAATSTSADSLFEQAAIDIPYDMNSIQTVFIMK
jgi:rod shape-determining protein MreC